MLVPWAKKTAEGMTTHSLTYEGTVRRGPFASPEPDHSQPAGTSGLYARGSLALLLFVIEHVGRPRTGMVGSGT